jgi:hypothetical protein
MAGGGAGFTKSMVDAAAGNFFWRIGRMGRNNPLCKVSDTVIVNPETGQEMPVEGGGSRIPPPAPGVCSLCAVEHDSADPHNQQSLYYQIRFHLIHGRWPSWTDAMAHCEPFVQKAWRQGLIAFMLEQGMTIPVDLQEEPSCK